MPRPKKVIDTSKPTKPYCGIGPLPAHSHLGSMKECLDANRVGRWGLHKFDNSLVEYAKEERTLRKGESALEKELFQHINYKSANTPEKLIAEKKKTIVPKIIALKKKIAEATTRKQIDELLDKIKNLLQVWNKITGEKRNISEFEPSKIHQALIDQYNDKLDSLESGDDARFKKYFAAKNKLISKYNKEVQHMQDLLNRALDYEDYKEANAIEIEIKDLEKEAAEELDKLLVGNSDVAQEGKAYHYDLEKLTYELQKIYKLQEMQKSKK